MAFASIGSISHPKTAKPQAILDEKGRSFQSASLLTELSIPHQPSFSLYAIIGDWGIITLALLGLVSATIFQIIQKSNPEARDPSPSRSKNQLGEKIAAQRSKVNQCDPSRRHDEMRQNE
jgi:hypothetical protein